MQVAAALLPFAPAAAQTSLLEEWRWVRFGVAEGLPSPIVNGIVRASDGTMWAATERGPAWYDGYRWRAVRTASGRQLVGERAGFVSAGSDGAVLFTIGTTAYRALGRDSVARPLPALPGGAQWSSRIVSVPGVVWTVVQQGDSLRLMRLQGVIWSREAWPGPAPTQSFDAQLHVAAAGELLLTVGTAVWLRRDGTWTPLTPFPVGRGVVTRYAFTPSGEERLVVRSPGTAQGVYARGPATGGRTWRKFPEFGWEAPVAFDLGPDGSAVAILDAGDFLYCDTKGWRPMLQPRLLATASGAAYDDTGDVWFSTRAGVVLWRRKSDRWVQWRVASSAPVNRVNGLDVARDGRLAAATAGGVAFPEPDGTLRVTPGLPTIPFTAIAWGDGNELWAGSGGSAAGVFQRTGAGWVHRTDALGLDRAGMHRIVRGRDGSFWLLGLPIGDDGRGGLWHATGNRIEAVHLPAYADGARFYDMVEDSTGVRWFATDRGVVRDSAGRYNLVPLTLGRSADLPFSLALGRDSTIWVGLRVFGVARIRRDMTLERPAAGDTFPVTQVTVHSAADGLLWATNPDGIWVRVGEKWSLLTASFGLPTQAVWPVTSAGSDIYVGTMGAGVLRLRLDELQRARPRVLMEPVHVEDEGLSLHWNVSTERGLVAPEDVATRYRMDDGAWSAWSDRRETVVTLRVPWLRHVIAVEARTPLGVLAAEPGRLTFNAPPPTWWRADLLAVLAALLGLLAWLSVLLSRRRRQQEALSRRVREAERMELVGSFAAGMAHELNNLLTTISVNAELVEDTPGHESPSPSDEIRRAAMQAAGQLRSVLAFTRDRSMVLGDVDLTAVLHEQQAPVSALFPSAIEVRWHIPPEPVRVLAEANAIAAILRALAENARESMASMGRFDVMLQVVRLDARQRAELGTGDMPRHAELAVTDSGAGMTAEQSLRAFEPSYPTRDGPGSGLVLVYGLMRRFGGAVHIESTAGTGTTLRLYFPMVEDGSAP